MRLGPWRKAATRWLLPDSFMLELIAMRNPHKPPEASQKDGVVQKPRHWGRTVHVGVAVSLLLLTVALIFPGLYQSGVELSSVATGFALDRTALTCGRVPS